MKKLLSAFLIVTTLSFHTCPAMLAVETKKTEEGITSQTDETTTDQNENTEERNNRKKTAAPSPTPKPEQEEKNNNEQKQTESSAEPAPTGPQVLSESAILISSHNGKVLFEKNSRSKMYPASTTKIMTAYLALQGLDLEEQVTASKAAISIPSDSSKLGMTEGEIFTAKDLLYALMVQSANDAANVLAEAVSGTISDFVNLMNQTALDLDMTDTHFANPHGYHADDHYTTAYDMSVLAKKAMENPIFREIVSVRSYKIPPTNKYNKERKFSTRNMLLSNSASLDVRYTYATGIKTGNTDAAGQCLVGSAKRSGFELISVVFKAPKETPSRAYIDSKNMYKYAFNTYTLKTVLKAGEIASTCDIKWASGKSHMTLETDHDIKTLLPAEEYHPELLTSTITVFKNTTAPIKKGDVLGEIKYFYDKEEVAVASLLASRDVSRSYIKLILSFVLNIWVLMILGLFVVIILLRRRKEKRRLARIRRMKRNQYRR